MERLTTFEMCLRNLWDFHAKQQYWLRFERSFAKTLSGILTLFTFRDLGIFFFYFHSVLFGRSNLFSGTRKLFFYARMANWNNFFTAISSRNAFEYFANGNDLLPDDFSTVFMWCSLIVPQVPVGYLLGHCPFKYTHYWLLKQKWNLFFGMPKFLLVIIPFLVI